MSLIINGIERDKLIIDKNLYKYDWEDMIAPRNARYRGRSLGAFTESHASAVANMQFANMYVGDTFTQNGHTYKIGGFNYLCGADNNPNLGNHLLMITDNLTKREMNPSATATGGFAGSEMWKSYFPTVVEQLKADFGDHLLTWNEFLTTGLDKAGDAANQGDFFPVQASMMNTTMYWGYPPAGSVPVNDGVTNHNYNTGIETKQLPITQLHPDEQRGGTQWTWQRDIYDSKSFLSANPSGYSGHNPASDNECVRAFFLLD